MLKGDHIFLRLVEHKDAMTILSWETKEEIRRVTRIEAPLSLRMLEALIDEQRNVFDSGQVRFILCKNDSNIPVGMVDLYNIDFVTDFAEVGIVVVDLEHRKKGYATEALNIIHRYAVDVLGLICLKSVVGIDNNPSMTLFKGLGYKIDVIESNRMGEKNKVFKIQF